MPALTRDEITQSLREFKRRRDNLLHEDAQEMEHHLKRFIEFCFSDPLLADVMITIPPIDSEAWWAKLEGEWFRLGVQNWVFSDDLQEEMGLRLAIMKTIVDKSKSMSNFGNSIGVYKAPELQQRFISLIVRPFTEYVTDQVAERASIPSNEARALQALPLHYIPSEKEIGIFLSHKTQDKEMVRRFANVLKTLGYKPWLDEQDMPVGTALDRGIAKGFEESCAVVFFITEHFRDEQFIQDEINYAKIQKREKGDKFSIVILRFHSSTDIPQVLKPYIFVDVKNEIEALYHLLRALPIELGRVQWKDNVVRKA